MKYELKVGQIYELIFWRKTRVKITRIQTTTSEWSDSIIYYKELGWFGWTGEITAERFVKRIACDTKSVIVEI